MPKNGYLGKKTRAARSRNKYSRHNLEDDKRKAKKLIEVWNREQHRDTKLGLIVSTEERSKDLLYRIISKNATEGFYIENAGIVTFYSGRDFAQDLIEAWLEGSNRLAKSYRGTIEGIESIEPSVKYHAAVEDEKEIVSLDDDVAREYAKWSLRMVGAFKAQSKVKGEGVTVAVLDTGIDYNHKDLKDNFKSEKGKDFAYGEEPLDKDGHGTHVAGTVAGKNTGVAPKATLYSVKVLGDTGSGDLSWVIAGVDWCITKKVDVMNMSLGSSSDAPSTGFGKIIKKAIDEGIYIAAAAGNRKRGDSYPASFEGVTSVAAVDINKRHPEFSNISDKLDISAPGVGIVSCYPGNLYAIYSGTSMASPHVAGAYALALSNSKSRDYEAVMKKKAEKLDYVPPGEEHDKVYGAGLLRTDRMLNLSQRLIPGIDYDDEDSEDEYDYRIPGRARAWNPQMIAEGIVEKITGKIAEKVDYSKMKKTLRTIWKILY